MEREFKLLEPNLHPRVVSKPCKRVYWLPDTVMKQRVYRVMPDTSAGTSAAGTSGAGTSAAGTSADGGENDPAAGTSAAGGENDFRTFEEFTASIYIADIDHVTFMKEKLNIRWPNNLQSVCWSSMLKESSTNSCIIQGKSGTGKTICSIFALLAICKIDLFSHNKGTLALYVVPSWEVGRKVSVMLNQYPSLRVLLLENGIQARGRFPVVIGTPDVISTWVCSQTRQQLSSIKLVVFNGMDNYLKLMEPYSGLQTIVDSLKNECRVMMMSETINQNFKQLSGSIQKVFFWLFLDKGQYNFYCSNHHTFLLPGEIEKFEIVLKYVKALKMERPGCGSQIIIVTKPERMKFTHDYIFGHCDGISTPELLDGKPVPPQAFTEFKTKKTQALITSGRHLLDWRFDKSIVRYVIFHDIPTLDLSNPSHVPHELYYHFSSRARDTVVSCLSDEREGKIMESMERFIGYYINQPHMMLWDSSQE